MATVVYQGFQSYFESQLFEPKALRLKLSSPSNLPTPLKSNFIEETNNTTTPATEAVAATSDPNSGGWSFLQSLSNDKESKTLNTYVQRPSSRRTLSDESLALCTESLGSETGSDIIHDDEFLSLSSDLQNMEIMTESRTSKSKKRNVVSTILPPPLTSMRGLECIQVKPHRENGRLVMTAVRAPPHNRCFQTDRSNGCVRVSMMKEKNQQETTIEEEEEKEEEKVMEKVERTRRCVENERENRGFLNWESCCIATS